MTSEPSDAAAVRIPPPLVYLAAVIVGAVLHAYVLPLRCDLGSVGRSVVTTAAALLGTVIMLSAIGLFKRTGQDPKPWKTTPEIISTGVYRYTRNPMYVGMALFQIALGVGFANGWILALLPPVLAIIYLSAIRHEEAYLESKFGDAYTAYKNSVRRWL